MKQLMLGFFFAATISCRPATETGAQNAPAPRQAAQPLPEDYPSGDAADVYRAALDLLYIDGDDRPSVIVMHDSASERSVGPCPLPCRIPWLHKAVMDPSTIEAFASIPRFFLPRIRKFEYEIPIVMLSYGEFEELGRAGTAYNRAHPTQPIESPDVPMYGEILRRYPGAWGWVDFTPVAFNRSRTEALLGIRQLCGPSCRSSEVVFFRKAGGKWMAIERVPGNVDAVSAQTRLRYRGPLGRDSTSSELLIDGNGAPLRPNAIDAPGIYRAVLDTLYSLHGERPRHIVLSARHASADSGLPPHLSRVDSSTLAAYNFVSRIADGMYPAFSYSLPISVLSHDSRYALSLQQPPVPVDAGAITTTDQEEPVRSWLAFRKRYPDAWGYVSLSRIGYNPEHTQALVYSSHVCGDGCRNSDTWFLTRKGDSWSIAERMPREEFPTWQPDSLRYLGSNADPKLYKPRRARGVFSNALTGESLPFLEVIANPFQGVPAAFRTDARGHYELDNISITGGVFLTVVCPIPGRSDTLHVRPISPPFSLDTVVDVKVDYRGCLHLNRKHPLIAGRKKLSSVSPSGLLSAEVIGVYSGVLDVLYRGEMAKRGPIMLGPFGGDRCDYCIESEFPRLIRKGVIEPSTATNFATVVDDTTMPRPFSYRRKIEVMSRSDIDWFAGQTGFQWDALKDAYPGVDAIISFSGVGFNSRRSEALVEVRVARAAAAVPAETMLLKKNGERWRVALRHVEKESTSGEWDAGKCEPTDAPDRAPTRAGITSIRGEFSIVRVVASPRGRGAADTERVMLEPLKLSKRPQELTAIASVLGANGEPVEKIEGDFSVAGDAATITFRQRMPPGMMMLDGWIEQYKILRTANGGFFGRWLSQSGPTVPTEGYFCANPIGSKGKTAAFQPGLPAR